MIPCAQAEREPRGDTAREKARWGGIGALALTLVALLASEAHAGCCRVTRVDPITPTGTVRVCEPDGNGGCGTVLFEGTLALGDARNVCVAGQTLIYQEYDTALSA